MWIDFYKKKFFRSNFKSSLIENHNFFNEIISFIKNWHNNNLLIRINTSGTTGNPKIIYLKKEDMYIRAIKSVEFLHLNHKKNILGLLCLSPNFIATKMFLVRAMIFKWKILCVYPCSNPLDTIDKNIIFDIVSMVPMQVFSSIENIKNIKNLLIGGGIINHVLESELQKQSVTNCYDTYGMTETCGHIALRKINGYNRDNYYKSFNDIKVDVDKRNCLKIFFLKKKKFFKQMIL